MRLSDGAKELLRKTMRYDEARGTVSPGSWGEMTLTEVERKWGLVGAAEQFVAAGQVELRARWESGVWVDILVKEWPFATIHRGCPTGVDPTGYLITDFPFASFHASDQTVPASLTMYRAEAYPAFGAWFGIDLNLSVDQAAARFGDEFFSAVRAALLDGSLVGLTVEFGDHSLVKIEKLPKAGE